MLLFSSELVSMSRLRIWCWTISWALRVPVLLNCVLCHKLKTSTWNTRYTGQQRISTLCTYIRSPILKCLHKRCFL